MVDNVTPFPKKHDPSSVEQFLTWYAKAVHEVDAKERPTNILILEIYKTEGEATVTAEMIAGPKMHIEDLMGTVECWKQMKLMENYLGEFEE